MKLDGKVAVITGGASGIGLATAKLFLENGAKVVIADVDENVKEVASQLGDMDKIVGINTNVSDDEEVELLFKRAINNFGHVDIVVSSAGIRSKLMCHEETMEEWDNVIGVNLTGVFLTNKYAIIEMLRQNTGGSIINISSVLGVVGKPTSFAYCASKGAVINMTKSIALSYIKDNIRVNVVAPGYVDTPLLDEYTEEMKEERISKHPIGRLADPIEIAKTILFLASDDSSFITGETIMVDGGYTIQ